MTDEIDIMRRTISEYDKAVRLKRINQELYDHLLGSLVWLFKYTEKYNIPLPKKEELYRLIKRAELLIDEIAPPDDFLQGDGNSTNPTKNGQNQPSKYI
jgi:hypothetical protein